MLKKDRNKLLLFSSTVVFISIVVGLISQTQDAHFRIRRTILLPSISEPETAKIGESPADSSLRGRSTGLLSRYGETNQK